MPVYEFICLDCQNQFEMMRPFKEADEEAVCASCGGRNTKKKMSNFFAHGESRSSASCPSHSSGGGCGSCRGGSCSSCRH